ncbi:MAG TPA: acyl-CoA dehydrogenase family protein [Aquabacterium sp.]|nr:acyl-CoA dehydrogenase family protein [Aquabacterium sp.]
MTLTLVPTPDQQQIADAARELMAAEWPLERLRDWSARDPGRWSTLVDLGMLGLGLPAEQGGLGLSCAEEALVFREAGRFLLPPRLLATVLAVHLAAAADQAELCSQLIAGERAAGLLVAAGPHRIGTTITGEFQVVDAADVLLAWTGGGAALVRGEDLAHAAETACLDDTLPLATCNLQDTPALAWQADAAIGLRADVLLSAYLVGIAEAARDMAADYAKLREAFGRPIGAFQAIKHRCADMAVAAEAAWCQTLAAALALRDGDPEARIDVAAARWLAAEAAQRNADGNVQVHGGIGFSAEALPHRFVKRALAAATWGAIGRRLHDDLLSPHP